MQKGDLVRYVGINPPIGYSWPVYGHIYRVKRTGKDKTLVDVLDAPPGNYIIPIWVPTENLARIERTENG